MSHDQPENDVHEVHDGIVELDNPAPLWWQRLFYITIAWGVIYMGWYLMGSGTSQKEEVAKKLLELELNRRAQSQGPDESHNELRAFYNDSGAMKEAHAIFQKNCVSCHGTHGGGGIGPNLTDNSWLHGDGSIDEIFRVVKEGVPDKGMPPWGAVLKRPELLQVSAYVRTLRGTKPTDPKAPQGAVIDMKNEI